MNMKIKFLGNGNITSSSFNASYLINEHILIDAPAGLNKKIKEEGEELNKINIIIITHLHGDHYFDLPFILFDFFAVKRTEPLIIIGPKNLYKNLKKLLKLAFPNSHNKILNSLDLTFAESSKIYNLSLGDIKVTAVNVIHGKLKDCYGYILDDGTKKIGFTGDCELCPGLTYIIKEVNACIIDVSTTGNNHHLRIDEFESLCKEYNILFLPTHHSDNLPLKLNKIKNIKILNCNEEFYI